MHVDSNRNQQLLNPSSSYASGSKRALSNPRGRKSSLYEGRSELSQRMIMTETAPTPLDTHLKLPSLKTTNPGTLAAPTAGASTPRDGHVINMDAAKRNTKKKPFTRRGMSVNVHGGEELSADEALKQYYDKMHALELKLKNDLE